jgi:hypothetical protein
MLDFDGPFQNVQHGPVRLSCTAYASATDVPAQPTGACHSWKGLNWIHLHKCKTIAGKRQFSSLAAGYNRPVIDQRKRQGCRQRPSNRSSPYSGILFFRAPKSGDPGNNDAQHVVRRSQPRTLSNRLKAADFGKSTRPVAGLFTSMTGFSPETLCQNGLDRALDTERTGFSHAVTAE